MEIQGQHSVYMVTNENKVESRQIVTGDRIGDLWLVNEGLNPGEKIVIDALQKVRPGMVVTPVVTEFTSKSNTKD
jgi:membrane fusion protein (multidrug efflux system)